jgi:predicted dinucleotide-binding enzyme
MGGTLGTLWVKAGHPVMFSSRNPEEIKSLVERLGPLARAGTVDEAVAFGDAVLLAVPYSAYPELGEHHARALAGKVLIDIGNAVPARDGAIAAEAKEAGIGPTTAKYFPGALIVRTFNTLAYTVIQKEANRPGERMAIPVAGDHAHALATAQQLVRDAGFDPVVIGGLARASEFAQGAPLYGQQLTAKQMRERAGLGQ